MKTLHTALLVCALPLMAAAALLFCVVLKGIEQFKTTSDHG